MARGADDAAARQALEEPCAAYWYPLYQYARRRWLPPQDVEDAVQAFYFKLLEHSSLGRVDRERGRLRPFLLGALSNCLTQRWRNENTAKRGGVKAIPIDREWAYALIDRVFNPHCPANRSGHRSGHRPSSRKQIPCNRRLHNQKPDLSE
jgi:DNA-directed RNA polymerase specialized sigma24 family protein